MCVRRIKSSSYGNIRDKSGKDGLLASLLGQDGSRFVLSFRVVGQLWRAGGDRAFQDGLLQVVENCRVLFGKESQGHTTLTGTTRTTYTMDVICRRRKTPTWLSKCFFIYVFIWILCFTNSYVSPNKYQITMLKEQQKYRQEGKDK